MRGRFSHSFPWGRLRFPIRGLPAVLTLLAGYSPASYSASVVEYCPPYSGVAQLEVDVKQPFLQYSLSVVDLADGRHVVTIVADDIRVDVKTLGALIRSASSFDPAVAKIVLQARRIRFAEHLSLVNASIELAAQEVVFEDGAAVTLLPDANSRLVIFARRIELASSSPSALILGVHPSLLLPAGSETLLDLLSSALRHSHCPSVRQGLFISQQSVLFCFVCC